ncbi:MAG: hypothetical protein ACE5WD_08335 [Candidatus Aminicenantia bacterium]
MYVNVVFVYRFQPPFGAVVVAYQQGAGEMGEVATGGKTLFLKISYVF